MNKSEGKAAQETSVLIGCSKKCVRRSTNMYVEVQIVL